MFRKGIMHRVKTDRSKISCGVCLDWRSNFTLCLKTKDILAKSAGGRPFFFRFALCFTNARQRRTRRRRTTPLSKDGCGIFSIYLDFLFRVNGPAKKTSSGQISGFQYTSEIQFQIHFKTNARQRLTPRRKTNPLSKDGCKFCPFDFLFRVKDV